MNIGLNAREKLYQLRSNLVHGSCSLHRSYNTELDFNAVELASYAIFLHA